MQRFTTGFRPGHGFTQNNLSKTAKIGFAETFDSTVYQTIDLCSSFSERKLKAICYSKIINTEEQKRITAPKS